MKTTHKILLSLVASAVSGVSQAGQPLVTFVPKTPTTISVYEGAPVVVYYTVTNRSTKPHTFTVNNLLQGASQVTSGSVCKSPFTLEGGASCTLALSYANTSGSSASYVVTRPQICQTALNGTPSPYLCYQSTVANAVTATYFPYPNAATLSISVTNLALSVNNTSIGTGELTGTPRHVRITNNGPSSTVLTTASYGTVPAGTSVGTACNTTLSSGSHCDVVITPGANPTSAVGYDPIPFIVQVTGNNSSPVSASIDVLSYGSVYQGGLLFYMNDTTPNTGSIGGTAVQEEQANSFNQWSINSNDIPGITEVSTTPCNGATNGACNSSQIIAYYTGVPPSQYAAGACSLYQNAGFSGWYSPAACQMSYGDTSGTAFCGSSSAPVAQNIRSNIVNLGVPNNGLNRNSVYWSSTESSVDTTQAWYAYFFSNGGTNPSLNTNPKTNATTEQVLCVRDFTQ